MFSTITRSGNGTAVLMIIIGIALLIFSNTPLIERSFGISSSILSPSPQFPAGHLGKHHHQKSHLPPGRQYHLDADRASELAEEGEVCLIASPVETFDSLRHITNDLGYVL